jgi:Transmembrane domain of unknown function (DUF3566)
VTRHGVPDESGTQVIPTSGATPGSGSGQSAGQARPGQPAEQQAPRTTSPRPDARRSDPQRSQPSGAAREAAPPREAPPSVQQGQPREVQQREAMTPDPNSQQRRWERRFTPQRVEPPDRARVRRARLRAVRVDPWSVMKTAFLLSIAFAVVTVVAVTVVWNVLQAAGVYDSISRTVTDVLGSASDTRFDLEDYIGLQRVLGFTALICVVDVVLITAIATLCAFLYNLSASLLGGLEVTLAEED